MPKKPKRSKANGKMGKVQATTQQLVGTLVLGLIGAREKSSEPSNWRMLLSLVLCITCTMQHRPSIRHLLSPERLATTARMTSLIVAIVEMGEFPYQ